MVASLDILIAAAQKFLCPGRKRLSASVCLDLTVQIIAVDLGVKPALLYDSNAASPEQIQQYLNSLKEFGFLTNALLMLSIDHNIFIFNPATMDIHLHELLQNKGLFLIDVCPSRDQPVLISFDKRTEDMIKALLEFLMTEVDRSSSVIMVEDDLYNEWNLCTLFGILLGYPASYWFDQTKGFENCLCMTPLTVCKVWVKWQIADVIHRCCLYSFSVPEKLWSEVRSYMQQWTERLNDILNKQAVLTDFCFSTDIVTLPSVTL